MPEDATSCECPTVCLMHLLIGDTFMLYIRAVIVSGRYGEITISVLCQMLGRALCMCHLT